MKFVTGVSMTDPSFYVPLARAAEEAGYDVMTIPDSICYPETSDSTYPYTPDGAREFLENKPFLEPMVAISAMAAATSRIEFCPFVLKLPIRHPVIFAKEATSLAVMSGGRLSLGVGTSPWPDDYEIVGLPWEHRGRRFEECIAIIRGLAAGGYFEFHGECYDVPPVKMNPVPSQPIPILIGGHAQANIRRAARLADGWMPAGMAADELVRTIGQLHDLRREYGREREPFAIYAFAMPDVDSIRQIEELGVTHVMTGYFGTFNPYGMATDTEPLADKIDRLRRFGDDVIAKFRG
jgi:probable F420-dependent oxidoreductase